MMTATDLSAASSALQDWFQSQDIQPAEAAMVVEVFLARLIVANGISEEKFELVNKAVRRYAIILGMSR